LFGDLTSLNHQTTSWSRADGDGRNCVVNKDEADFPLVLESDHTMAGHPRKAAEAKLNNDAAYQGGRQ
jgi:hypothetical protein